MLDANVLGLADKSALVVGGGSGIGRATCQLLARAGAKVIVGDLDPSAAGAVADGLSEQGASAAAVAGNVMVEKEAIDLVNSAADLHGQLDVLINIVGMAGWVKLLDMDAAAWELDLQRNLNQHLYVSRAAARRMIDQGSGGSMSLVASVSGIYGAANHGAYGAAKAGLMALARTMAIEWGEHGIRVNTVAPDMIDTPRVVAARERSGVPDSPDFMRHSRLVIERRGVPDDIAGALVFLVSELSAFMTGQALVVDGGRQVKPLVDAPSMPSLPSR
ncbi:SDR family oxidoreductase [Myxococcota bacterium]|nr:SDR family oxidoreductase [Myxococcota bacterium]